MVGPSGCGKSTVLNLVAGLDMPTSGCVRIGGEEVTRPHAELGVVFQRDLLLEWRSILDNVLLQADLRGRDRAMYADRARELLAMVGLEQFLDRHPRELSGGMRQRASICRALVHDPAVLLMDEPFGALDAITRDQLNVELSEICHRAETTTLFITHSVAEAVFLADQVVVMSSRPGRVVGTVHIDEPMPRTSEFLQSETFAKKVVEVRELLHKVGVL
jgi:NitT/TauT family transport system ATP-binding protein